VCLLLSSHTQQQKETPTSKGVAWAMLIMARTRLELQAAEPGAQTGLNLLFRPSDAAAKVPSDGTNISDGPHCQQDAPPAQGSDCWCSLFCDLNSVRQESLGMWCLLLFHSALTPVTSM
jgi:hypothetical protein